MTRLAALALIPTLATSPTLVAQTAPAPVVAVAPAPAPVVADDGRCPRDARAAHGYPPRPAAGDPGGAAARPVTAGARRLPGAVSAPGRLPDAAPRGAAKPRVLPGHADDRRRRPRRPRHADVAGRDRGRGRLHLLPLVRRLPRLDRAHRHRSPPLAAAVEGAGGRALQAARPDVVARRLCWPTSRARRAAASSTRRRSSSTASPGPPQRPSPG